MGDGKHTRSFSAKAHESIVRRVVEEGEAVNKEAQRQWRETRTLDPVVDVKNGRVRKSHNAMMRREDGKFVMTLGPAVAIASCLDATHSFSAWYRATYLSIGSVHGMLPWYKRVCNPQLASSLVQDVDDETPVLQFSEFETDERITKQMEALMPADNGYDPTEDYDLFYLYLDQRVDADIYNFYGLGGYAFLTADQLGRGSISRETAKRHLGVEIQGREVDTAEIINRLHDKWHLFYLLVHDDASVTRWWNQQMGRKGHVVYLPSAKLGAAMQVGLMYATETKGVEKSSFVDFIMEAAAGTNSPLSRPEALTVWESIDRAGVRIGAQAERPNYHWLPKPGDVFVDLRDPWPEGHEYFHLNPSQTGKPAGSAPAASAATTPSSDAGSDAIDWSSF